MHGPNPTALAVAALVVVSLAVGVWFFLLRGADAATGEFLTAHDRVVAAERAAEAAAGGVQRFLELPRYEALVNDQISVMERQDAIFLRLARQEDGERAQLAAQASHQTQLVIMAAGDYRESLTHTYRLSDTAVATTDMRGGVTAIDRLAAEWKRLQ